MYMNSLIGLEENMPTYGIDGKKINGHVTISTPGIIKCYVQNIKVPDNTQLILYAFSSKEDRGVRVGPLVSSLKSKETKWLVDENDVMNSRIKAKDIDAIAVVKEGDSMRSADTILIGFARSKYSISSILQTLLMEYYKLIAKPDDDHPPMPPIGEEIQVPEVQIDPEIQVPQDIQHMEAMPEPPIAEEIQVPEYVTEVPEPPIAEEIQVPEYVTEVPELPIAEEVGVPGAPIGVEMQVPQDVQHMEEIQHMQDTNEMTDIEESEMPGNNDNNLNNNNNWDNDNYDNNLNNNNYNNNNNNNNNNWDDNDIGSTMPKNRMERVLQETYLNRKNDTPTNQYPEGERLSRGKKLNEPTNKSKQIERQEEIPEEVTYLEKIEEKLKDIQARIKGSDTLEENIRRFEQQNLLNREDNEKPIREPDLSSPIQELIDKIADFNTTASVNQTYEHTLKIDNKLRELYTHAPKVQPFEDSSDKIDWVQIALSDLEAIPTLSRKWATQPFVTFSYYKYNEIILGKEKATEKYYIGIPDIYHPERRHILQGDSKVERFKCRKDVDSIIGEYGYWLVGV